VPDPIPTSTPDSAPARLAQQLAAARKQLLDQTTRSRLLHAPVGSKTAKVVEVVDELAEPVFRMLVHEGKSMTFLPALEESADQEALAPDLLQPDEVLTESQVAEARHLDSRLQTALPPAKLQKRLLQIAYDAESLLEEQGVNILYLAVGFLKWFDPSDPTKAHVAPLILIPATLSRPSANEKFHLAYSGEEISTNLSLQARLKELDIDLPELPPAEDLSPDEYARQVQSRVGNLPGWGVQPNTILLGFFTFAKLLMYRDLDPELWPLGRGLREHPLINGLMGDGFRSESVVPGIPDDVHVDDVIDISTAPHVVDADSSQMIAIEEVQRGRNMVIQGPPGTGKSQTITNLVASAVNAGKRVLFVAEKRAALEVVRGYLERAELGALCLELHSHKAKKKAVLEELRNTFQGAAPLAGATPGLLERVRVTRDRLNAHAKHMHTPLLPCGLTPFEVFGSIARLSGAGVGAGDFRIEEARGWDRDTRENRYDRVSRLAALVEEIGVPAGHPWRGVGLEVVLPQDAQRLAKASSDLAAAATGLIERASALGSRCSATTVTWRDLRRLTSLGEILGKAPALDPTCFANPPWRAGREITDLLEAGHAYLRSKNRLKGVLRDEAWDADLSEVKRVFVAQGSFLLRWLNREYRDAVARFRELHDGPAPKVVGKRIEILTALADGQRAHEKIRAGQATGRLTFGSFWLDGNSDWDHLSKIASWETSTRDLDLPEEWRQHLPEVGDFATFAEKAAALSKTDAALRGGVLDLFAKLRLDPKIAFGVSEIEDAALGALQQRLSDWGASASLLQQWVTWRLWGAEAGTKGAGAVADRLGDGRLASTAAVGAFKLAVLEELAHQALEEYPDLASFQGRAHDAVVAEFQGRDRQRLLLARREVGLQHAAGIPRGDRPVGELGILSREWQKQKRHLPLRRLIKVAGRAILAIKPVWMMSPMSLAQFALSPVS
jgi:hypothetical protein